MGPSPIKLVCFDLDDTILNGRLNWSLEQAGVAPGQASPAIIDAHLEKIGGIKNRMALQKTMKDLLKGGVHIAITSFNNHPESIPYILAKVGLTPDEIAQIKDLSNRPEPSYRKEHGKNDHVQQAIDAFGGNILPQEVVLVDDSVINYELAKKKGYDVIWVQGSEHDVGYLNTLREMTGLSTFRAAAPASQAAPAETAPKSWADKLLGIFGLQRIQAVSPGR